MARQRTPEELGTAGIAWDLTAFYAAANDARLEADVAEVVALMAAFERDYRGKLDTRLGDALQAYGAIVKLLVKVGAFFNLGLARDTGDTALRQVQSRAQEKLAQAQGRYLTFFELEVGRLDEAALARQQADAVVAQHMPWLGQVRAQAAHHLAEDVEAALVQRAPYGPEEWNDMLDELDAGLRFAFEGAETTLPEILHIANEDTSRERRAAALKTLDDGLVAQKHPYFVARALNVLVGDRLADDAMRGFAHPMAAVNLGNMVDDATVEALHDAVRGKGAELAKRFYTLKARLLGVDTLRWSDRNAPLPFTPEAFYGWEASCDIVRQAYHAFSPTLGALVDRVLDPAHGWVDAAVLPAKTSGAFDYTVVVPEGVRTYMMLNHMGATGDVMTLAHELGHAVHGLLAGPEQGPLQWHAPMPYAETASVFGEMLTFESLLAQAPDTKAKLALYMTKMAEFLNTVVRQINFSCFEKAVYARRRDGKLAVEDFNRHWGEEMRAFYGADGEVFTYDDTAHLWSYVGHFHSYRFYVYSYAFGELFTQSLMAVRPQLGARFEPLYLDLLRAGGTKGAVELMAPFGLDPSTPDFWTKGLEVSFGVWLQEAERLVDELGL